MELRRLISSTIEEEMRNHLEGRERLLHTRLDQIAATQTSLLQSLRADAESARAPLDAIERRLLVVSQRLDNVSTEQVASRTDLRAAGSDIRAEGERTQQLIGEVVSQIKRRIDLDDANQVLRLREEIAKRVNSEMIREFSKALVPALEALREAVNERDLDRETEAMTAVLLRCSQLGLITDMSRLF